MSDSRPIGIFDSGVGGLTVLKAIRERLPKENFLYFGDTLHFPYGEKTAETIIQYGFEIASFLNEHQIKALVIACNTASAFALKELIQKFDFPILGVIQPSAKKALAFSPRGNIAVLGTRGTIRSMSYQKTLLEMQPHSKILPIECPLLAPIVEENFTHHLAARLIMETYLEPLRNFPVECLLLGCTHYPLLLDQFRELMGNIPIVDSASCCAEELCSTLKYYQIENHNETEGEISYFVSEDPEKFQKLGKVFLKTDIEVVQKVNLCDSLILNWSFGKP